MQLTGRLGKTTLGDLLGTLHRAGATGSLELTDERTGRAHNISLASGLVVAVGPYTVGTAPRSVVAARLRMLEQMKDARVCFRVAIRPVRSPETGIPLTPAEFLYGRPRARDTGAARASSAPPPAARPKPSAPPPPSSAWSTLGVRPGADLAAIKSAFRSLARKFHPDLYPQASDDERKRLAYKFAEVTAAYRDLVA